MRLDIPSPLGARILRPSFLPSLTPPPSSSCSSSGLLCGRGQEGEEGEEGAGRPTVEN